jgi:hypothetical protein
MEKRTVSNKRQNERRILLAALTIVIAACIGAALFFGQTSPVIAEGKVVLKPEFDAQAQGMRTVYIIVRDPASPMPMPYGAMATTLTSDAAGNVMNFKLTKENLRVMAEASSHPQKVTIKARLDMDGLGGSDQPGDIVGILENVDWGARNLTIALDQLVTTQPEPQIQ